MGLSPPAGTVAAAATASVDTAHFLSKERPPLQHMETSDHTVTSVSHGYANAADPEKGPSLADTRKRRPHSHHLMKDAVDKLQGYHDNGEQIPLHKHNSNNHSDFGLVSPDNTNVVVDDEIKKTKLGKFYAYLLTASIVTRWLLFIVPLLAILWIPGILSLTAFPNAKIWGVGLMWWSIWLTVIWAGWWAALAAAHIVPIIMRLTVGTVAISTKRYIDWLQRIRRYTAFFGWTLAVWISYQPLINIHRVPSIGRDSTQALNIIGRLLFGFFLCAAILLFEKFSIQYIAAKFHETSYADRIAAQKAAVKTLVILYKHSANLPSDSAPLTAEEVLKHPEVLTQRRFIKQVGDSMRAATATTATVFGNVASEIMGSSVFQPNSPQGIVKTTLESRRRMLRLAQRIFRSFAKKGSDSLVLENIQGFFPTREAAIAAFILFDKDENGDVTQEEFEMACLEIYSEQHSLENSIQDLSSAVRRLDNILMSLYVIIAAVVMAVVLVCIDLYHLDEEAQYLKKDAQVTTLITGAGTLVLGLSWLIGGSLQEVLTSIIFLFVKHPFDVGDRVVINKETYTVKEIMLLSTVFLDSNSTSVQAPNSQLSTQFIQNFRRSPQMSETFTFEVNYGTAFADLENLRDKMLAFVMAERRDFQPVFDVTVKDFPEQTKMTLSADIRYKSNIQHPALRVKRRNKWICELKTILAELKIYGPAGDPCIPPVNRYTEVPYRDIQQQDEEAKAKKEMVDYEEDRKLKVGEEWKLGEKNTALMDSDVFENSGEAPTPQHGPSPAHVDTGASSPQRPPQAMELFEMKRTGA